MGYELNIRQGSSGVEGQGLVEVVTTALRAHGELQGELPTGPFQWTLGATRCALRPASRDGEDQLIGIDFELPYGAVSSEVDACLQKVLAVAQEHKLLVFDPQLGTAVGRGDADRILERFEQASGYQVELAGQSEDVRQGMESAADVKMPTKTSTQVKVLLVLVGIFVLAYLVFRACVVSPMLDQLRGAEPEQVKRKGPPKGWLINHPPIAPEDVQESIVPGPVEPLAKDEEND